MDTWSEQGGQAQTLWTKAEVRAVERSVLCFRAYLGYQTAQLSPV